MQLNYKLFGLLLIFSLAQVSRAQLKCYICENCAEVKATTPLLDCNADFFNAGGNNEPSTQTTTSMPIETTDKMPTGMPPTSSSTTSSVSTSTVRTTESTTTPTPTTVSESTTSPHTVTEETPTTESHITSTSNSSSATTTANDSSTTSSPIYPPTTTEPSTVVTDSSTHIETTTTSAVTQETESSTTNATGSVESNSTLTTIEQHPPTPSTAHPTSAIPTPPNPSAEAPVNDNVKYVVNGTEGDRSSTKPYIVSSQFRLRQSRSVSEYTYHCFRVTANVNSSMVINRGCARVKSTESVCGQWKEQHPTEPLNKCHPCSNTRCNGSTTLNLSLGALALTLVAAILQRK